MPTTFQAEIDAAAEMIDFFRFNSYFAKEIMKYQPISENPNVTLNLVSQLVLIDKLGTLSDAFLKIIPLFTLITYGEFSLRATVVYSDLIFWLVLFQVILNVSILLNPAQKAQKLFLLKIDGNQIRSQYCLKYLGYFS